jgi:hypothetical protein
MILSKVANFSDYYEEHLELYNLFDKRDRFEEFFIKNANEKNGGGDDIFQKNKFKEFVSDI